MAAIEQQQGAKGPRVSGGVQPRRRNTFMTLRDTALQWREVAHLAQVRHYRKKEVLLPAGTMVDHLFFIHSGEVRRTFIHTDGREKTLFYIGEHTFVGEMMFFLGVPSRSQFVCSKATTVWAFSRQCLMETILPSYPDLVEELFISLAAKARLLDEHLLIMALDDTVQRFCKLLSLYVKRTEAGALVACLPMGKQEQAALLGVHRISLYKVMKVLEEQGVVRELERNCFHILDEEAFAAQVSSKDGQK